MGRKKSKGRSKRKKSPAGSMDVSHQAPAVAKEGMESAEGDGHPKDTPKSSTATAKVAEHSSSDSDEDIDLPPRPDCPICMQALPIKTEETKYQSCCGQVICLGCHVSRGNSLLRERNTAMKDKSEVEQMKAILDSSRAANEWAVLPCAFCREPASQGREERSRLKRHVKKGEARAATELATNYLYGRQVAKDERIAFEWFVKASDLGCLESMMVLSDIYNEGRSGVPANPKKSRQYLDMAAKGGHVPAQCKLAQSLLADGNQKDALKYLRAAASAGDSEAMKMYWNAFSSGLVGKDDLTRILRAHQAAEDELKSEARKDAIDFLAFGKAASENKGNGPMAMMSAMFSTLSS